MLKYSFNSADKPLHVVLVFLGGAWHITWYNSLGSLHTKDTEASSIHLVSSENSFFIYSNHYITYSFTLEDKYNDSGEVKPHNGHQEKNKNKT